MVPTEEKQSSPSHTSIYSAIARYALFIVLILSFLYISWRVAEWVIEYASYFSENTFFPTVVIVTDSSASSIAPPSPPLPISSTVTEQSIIDMMRSIR